MTRSAHGLPVDTPFTIRIAADCFPRMSPPASCAASSAASIRSARSPCADSNARRHRPPDPVVGHQVRLHGVAASRDVSGPLDALRPGVRRDVSLRVDHRDLPDVPARVGGEKAVERLPGRLPAPHQGQSERPVRRIDERLRRNRSDTRLRPRHNAPHREPVRLHGDAQVAGDGILRHDRVRVHGTHAADVLGQPGGGRGREGRSQPGLRRRTADCSRVYSSQGPIAASMPRADAARKKPVRIAIAMPMICTRPDVGKTPIERGSSHAGESGLP